MRYIPFYLSLLHAKPIYAKSTIANFYCKSSIYCVQIKQLNSIETDESVQVSILKLIADLFTIFSYVKYREDANLNDERNKWNYKSDRELIVQIMLRLAWDNPVIKTEVISEKENGKENRKSKIK